MLTLADDRLIYKTSSDISTAVTAVQEQLEKVSHWCQEINPSKAQALWCTLNNKSVGQAMPAVSFNGEAIERTNSLRYLGIHFDRMLTYKMQVESTKLRCKKGLSALKAMASKGIEQRHLFLLYQSVILSVIDYGLSLTTLSQSNLLKLDRVQNEAMRVILGTTKDTPIETMRYLLDLPSMETRQGVASQGVSQCDAESQESTPRCCQRRKGVYTAVQGLRFSCYSWAPEPRHPVHVTDVYATESRTPLVRELSADRFSVGLLLHCSPPSRVRAGEWAKVCGGQAPLWSAASAEKQRIFFLFRLQPTRHRYSLAHSTAHMSSGQSTK